MRGLQNVSSPKPNCLAVYVSKSKEIIKHKVAYDFTNALGHQVGSVSVTYFLSHLLHRKAFGPNFRGVTASGMVTFSSSLPSGWD